VTNRRDRAWQIQGRLTEVKRLRNVRFWRKADNGPPGSERPLLTQSGHFRVGGRQPSQSVFHAEGIDMRVMCHDEHFAESNHWLGEMHPVGNDLIA